MSQGFLKLKKTHQLGNSLVVQWLGHCALTAKGPGSIPGGGIKILHAEWSGQNNKILKKNKPLRSASQKSCYFFAHVLRKSVPQACRIMRWEGHSPILQEPTREIQGNLTV